MKKILWLSFCDMTVPSKSNVPSLWHWPLTYEGQWIEYLYKFQIGISSNIREIKYQNIGRTHRHTHRWTDRVKTIPRNPFRGRGNDGHAKSIYIYVAHHTLLWSIMIIHVHHRLLAAKIYDQGKIAESRGGFCSWSCGNDDLLKRNTSSFCCALHAKWYFICYSYTSRWEDSWEPRWAKSDYSRATQSPPDRVAKNAHYLNIMFPLLHTCLLYDEVALNLKFWSPYWSHTTI